MKKLYQIVFYEVDTCEKVCETNILFEDETIASEIGHEIGKNKKWYYKLVEFLY